MNGKDIIRSLGSIGSDLIEEAEFGKFASTPAKRTARPRIRRPLLLAAMIALMLLMACTAAAVAYTQGWFADFFTARSDAPLSEEQLSFIEEHEQMIQETQVQNDWTIELKSAINDGNTAFIILSVRGPEGVPVGNEIVDGTVKTWMLPGNGGMRGDGDIITCSEGISSSEGNYWYQVGSSWSDDGDGLENTGDLVFKLIFNKFHASEESSITDPFGPDMDFYIHIENLVLEYDDEDYRQELMNGKYQGQTDVMFTPEETERLIRTDVLAKGTWDFTINFAESEAGVELLSQPVSTPANVSKRTGPEIFDYVNTVDDVTMTSFVLKPLSAVIYYEYDGNANFPDLYAVMRDGTQIRLNDYGAGGDRYSLLEAESPIVLEEVDYILLSDGTKLPMPE